jgi:hypothetical protein
MPKRFRESFEEMLDALQAHPKVEVFDALVRPPASGEAIKDAERMLGRALPDDVLDFYLAHDGVYLAWGLKGREYGNAIEPFGWPDYGTPPGVINLLPIVEAFSPGWVQDFTINWTADDHRIIYGVDQDEDDKRVHAVVVDFYSKFYHADLVFGPVDRPGFVLIADDHGAELMESNLSSFTTYLDVVLACWGTERMPHYKVSRYRQPQQIQGPKSRPTLDAVVADAEADAN